MYVFIFGVPGVGKSSVTKKYPVVNFGDIMVKLSNIERDKLRFVLDYKKTKQLQIKAAKYIKNRYKKVLVDTHGIILSETELKFGTPKAIIKILKPKAIVCITASPEEIKKRREKDKEIRERGKGLEKDITFHQNLEIISAMMMSYLYNIPLFIIENKQGKLKEAQQKLENILEMIGWKK